MEVTMTAIDKPTVRHTAETGKLKRALEDDAQAANGALKFLSSRNPFLRQIMQETIHDMGDPRIWDKLLRSLAFHRWDDHVDCERRADPEASERIDQSVTEVFILDESEWEKHTKEATLLEALNSPESQLRQAAAYLLGLRCDPQAIHVLEETIEKGYMIWKLRAIRALAALKDERCGLPLIKALVMDRDELHREARLALKILGPLAKLAWLEALDHPDSHIRWHAARGLGEIGDASAALVLAEGLYDENRLVRWATADVLAHLGEPAVPAILTALSRHELDEPFRQAAYHALHGITSRQVRERIKPLLDALSAPAADVSAPTIAQRLLMEWKEAK
jgi:HEAT repeat protein